MGSPPTYCGNRHTAADHGAAPQRRPRTNFLWPLGVNGKPRTDEVDVDGDGWISNNDWLDASADFWEEAFENWDTETVSLGPIEIASGWWTARQLLMYYPKSNITPAAARKYVTWDPTWGGLLPAHRP